MEEYLERSSGPNRRTRGSCPVCCTSAVKRHFGGKCCDACAAFFRRTVANKRIYTCKFRKACRQVARAEGIMCKYCRFVGCLRSGMCIREVQGSELEPCFGETTLCVLVRAYRWTFMLRMDTLAEIYGSAKVALAIVNTVATGKSTVRSYLTEARLVKEFLAHCQLSEKLGIENEDDLARLILCNWVRFEYARRTAHSKSFVKAAITCPDDAILPLDEDKLVEHFRTYAALRDPDMLARYIMVFFLNVLKLAREMHRHRLDDVEQTSLLTLHILAIAADHFDVHEAAGLVAREVMNELHNHYVSLGTDIPLRLDAVMRILGELRRIEHTSDEWIVLMRLSGREPLADFFASTTAVRSGGHKYYMGTVLLDD